MVIIQTLRRILIAGAALLSFTCIGAADSYVFTTVNSPFAPLSTYSQTGDVLYGINNSGQIVGAVTDSVANGSRAFIGSGGVFTDVSFRSGDLGEEYWAAGINNTGFFTEDAHYFAHGYGAGLITMNGNAPVALNIRGTVGVPPISTTFTGLNDRNQIVGVYDQSGDFPETPFLYDYATGATTVLTGGTPAGINNAGTILMNTGDGFFLTSGSSSVITFPGAAETTANGINNLGAVVGTYSLGANSPTGINDRGFLYANSSFTTIDVPGSYATDAEGINDLGQIVGWYDDATGEHGFIATPTPEPGSIGLLFAGAVVGAFWLRRRVA